jgi:hypothetical protein
MKVDTFSTRYLAKKLGIYGTAPTKKVVAIVITNPVGWLVMTRSIAHPIAYPTGKATSKIISNPTSHAQQPADAHDAQAPICAIKLIGPKSQLLKRHRVAPIKGRLFLRNARDAT